MYTYEKLYVLLLGKYFKGIHSDQYMDSKEALICTWVGIKHLKYFIKFVFCYICCIYEYRNIIHLEKRRKSCDSYNIDEVEGQQAIQNKLSSGRQMFCDFMYIKFKANLLEQTVKIVTAKGWMFGVIAQKI